VTGTTTAQDGGGLAVARKVFGRSVVPAVLATVFWATGRDVAALLFAVVAVVLAHLGVLRPTWMVWLDERMNAIGRAASTVVLAVGHILIVAPVWAVGRAARFDQLSQGGPQGWTPAASRRSKGPRTWARRSFGPQARPPAKRRAHALAFLAIPLVSTLIGTIVTGGFDQHPSAPVTVAAPAGTHSTLQQVLFKETDESGLRYDALAGVRMGEKRGRYVNVHDRVRRSWEPAGQPDLTVWFFGGSTVFGLGQRDDHTIPSEFARAAAATGLKIRVVNYGVLSYVNWQEMLLFEFLLSGGARPDYAVFYDGCNETNLALDRTINGEPHPGEPRYLTTKEVELDIGKRTPHTPRPEPLQLAPKTGELRTAIARGADQYGRGTKLISGLAGSYDVPVRFVWQPTIATKRLTAPERARFTQLRARDWGSRSAATIRSLDLGILARSGAHVLDMSAALDDYHGTPFFDECHTTERAAATIAQEMFHDLRPALVPRRPR